MQSLIDSISKYISPSPAFIDALSARVEPVSFNKGAMMHDANEICKHSYFIISGIARIYFIKPDGKEVSEFFASDKEWINSPVSFMQQKLDDYYIDVLEDTEAISLDVESLIYLFDHFPEMERYSRLDMGSLFGHIMSRLASMRFTSAEEKYVHFCQSYATINHRIPLHMVATYLGITQETLSRIRSRKISF